MKKTVPVLILLAVIVFSGCIKKKEISYFDQSILHVSAISIKTEDYTDRIETFGTAVFEKKADVTAAVDGIANDIRAEISQRVSQGQILLVLSNIQMTIRQAQAQTAWETAVKAEALASARYMDALAQMEAQFIRFQKTELEKKQKQNELQRQQDELVKMKALLDLGGVTPQAYKDAVFSYDAAKLAFELFEKDTQIASIGFRNEDIISHGYKVPASEAERIEVLKLINTMTVKAEWDAAKTGIISAAREKQAIDEMINEMTLRSPISGIVGARMIEKGERTQTGTKLFTVFDSSRIFIVFTVEASRLIHLGEGMNVSIIFDALGGKTWTGKLSLISPTVDSASGSVSLKAILENPDGRILPGMFSRVSIDTGKTRQTIFIPETALARKEADTAVVYVISNNKAFLREVKLGIFQKGRYEIRQGLEPGDSIIDLPAANLKEGQAVETGQ